MTSIKTSLFGPAALVLGAAVAVAAKRDKVTLLFDGDPGVGKTTLADALALHIAGTPHAIETVNGQSLNIDLVRQWRCSACYGNLFSPWTVKRVDELVVVQFQSRRAMSSASDQT